MKKAIKTKWLKALRSGKYRQHRGDLCKDGRYCAFGVLGAALNQITHSKNGNGYWLSGGQKCRKMPKAETVNSYGLTASTAETITSMNDCGMQFNAIADWIEENL